MKHDLLLAIDIGNTNISVGLIDRQGKILKKFFTPTEKPDMKLFAAKTKGEKIEKILIVSVVPSALNKLIRQMKKHFKHAQISVIGRDIKVPMKSEYNKNEIGEDRLVTAFAAKTIYGSPILIIDFGTAVTFDCVSANGVYLGGLILPGIKMSLESLASKTALLPKTYLKKTSSFIGKNTTSSIRSGMIYGYSAICDGLIKLFRKKIGETIKIVATGGDAGLIKAYTPSIRKADSNLALKGLYLMTKEIQMTKHK